MPNKERIGLAAPSRGQRPEVRRPATTCEPARPAWQSAETGVVSCCVQRNVKFENSRLLDGQFSGGEPFTPMRLPVKKGQMFRRTGAVPEGNSRNLLARVASNKTQLGVVHLRQLGVSMFWWRRYLSMSQVNCLRD